MLGRADGLARRLETSIALGADDSRLPASALLFQHPVERDILAVALGRRFNRRDKNIMRTARRSYFFAFANRLCAKPAKAIYTEA